MDTHGHKQRNLAERLLILLIAATPCLAGAQAPEAIPTASPPTVTPAPQETGTTANRDTSTAPNLIPTVDPASGIISWNGQTWNINNNRLFNARFEKYLNAPEETTQADLEYQGILRTILDKLSPARITPANMDAAFRLLPKAAAFDSDARLCDSIADSVYSVWMARKELQRLAQANDALREEQKATEWNAGLASAPSTTGGTAPKNVTAAAEWAKERALKRDTQMAPYTTRIAEIKALILANQAKRELSQMQTKIEFQALCVQLFLQRRFQHVLIATRFYRGVFGDGDTLLRVGDDARSLFGKTTGMPPTVSTLDTMANEVIRDCRESVQAYEFLLEKGELKSATERLAEGFVPGEYTPEFRTLSREKKRAALKFTQASNQLLSALDVKDFTLAEKLVHDLEETARDFDSSKPMAAIQTAKTVAGMHLAKAKNAAVSGDRAALETELKEATAIWPRNPALGEVSGVIFKQADVQLEALDLLDELLGRKEYRRIYDDRVRFIAAAALYPERQEQLQKVLDAMTTIEGTITRAMEIEKRGDAAGAWETVEHVYLQYPNDNKLNELRANLTTEASEFVKTLRAAERLEKEEQVGSSLAWYLKAQSMYPGSEFAQKGIERQAEKILK
ncbi:MAG TPA: hypothetical protein VIT91_16260 [Chthoniobacterales bacterium]